ncbi:MAG: DUF3426 domain-containing protein [Proteobacteria bacterium]|uniref:DUF3426 domain-containing protein n=1 Tax=Aquabacterium sp. TaxID=1872578 RepID=UPI0035C6F7C3|nr:DUF3426 domain-containing protein [Pseudomonadota bacterium]
MSLATRCTHCGTIFKVVQDQLKVSEGWVRCGRCHEIFNALPSLFDLDNEPPPPRRQVAPEDGPTQAASHEEDHGPSTFAESIPPAGFPPSEDETWHRTRPTDLAPPTPISAHTPLTAADLAMDAQPLPAATDFDLDFDTQTAQQEPPQRDDAPFDQDLPVTDESDALDSRYLLPSDAARLTHRRPHGPEFADAQFPSDAMLDAEEDWAQAPPPPAATLPHVVASTRPADEAPPLPPASSLLRAPSAVGDALRPDTPLAPSDDPELAGAPPSRFGTDFVPEQVQPPPSKRQGRSGTRGRDPATQTPEFVKHAQRQAFWRHPATRGVLLTVLLGLVLGLGLQLMHQFRDLIAAHNPEARPLLTAWCEQVGCKIAPPLRLEALQVDSATLLRTSSEGPDRYRLTVTVHNRSDIGVAWPHIDLSLTDEAGSVIARRAFQAPGARVVRGEGASQTLTPLPEAVPAQQSTTLQWSLRLDALTPAGYTAELFYP